MNIKSRPEDQPLKYLNETDLPGFQGVASVIVDEKAPHNPSITGYGPKIPTNIRLNVITRGGRRAFRVYAMVYGNSGTPYILKDRQVFRLTPEIEEQIAEARALA